MHDKRRRIQNQRRMAMILVDFATAMKAKKMGVKMYDANLDGNINNDDLNIITGQKVAGVSPQLGCWWTQSLTTRQATL